MAEWVCADWRQPGDQGQRREQTLDIRGRTGSSGLCCDSFAGGGVLCQENQV